MLTIVRNIHVYEPTDLGENDLVLGCGKIIAIGKNLAALYPAAKEVDGTNLLAFPGYIDQHVHVTGGGGEGSFKTRVPELQLTDCIKAGVTTLVGVLGTDGITRNIENLLAKTKALNEEGITAYCLTGSYQYPTITLTGDLKKDIAFIQEIIGVKIALSDHRSSQLTKEELIRVASEVRLASLIGGKPGLVTIHLGTGKRGLDLIFDIINETDLPIKHFRPTHIGKHSLQGVEFAKRGGYIDFTADEDGEETARQIAAALAQGAPLAKITLSSDANGSMPKWNEQNEMIGIKAASLQSLHSVIKALIRKEKLGIPEALSLLTVNPAKALGLEQQKGRLMPGYDGDLLILDKELNLLTVSARGRFLLENGKIKVRGCYE